MVGGDQSEYPCTIVFRIPADESSDAGKIRGRSGNTHRRVMLSQVYDQTADILLYLTPTKKQI